MKRMLLLFVMIGFGLSLTASQALAIDLGTLTGGDLQIHFQNIDKASLYTSSNDPKLGDSNMDSFALITVTDINRLSNNSPIWQQNSTNSGEYLTGMFYGLMDMSATVMLAGPLTVNVISSTGGYIDIFLNDNSVVATGLGHAAPVLTGTAAPTDNWDATSANLFLRLEVIPGTYSATATFDAFGGVTGSSSGYLRAIGGSAMSLFDDNSYDAYYTGADMYMYNGFTNLDPLIPAEKALLDNGWNLGSTGNVKQPGVVPEPASMILMGIGLAGAARLRRKA